MTTVWILMKGEDYEGGDVLGVYASRDLARGAFAQAAAGIPFAIDDARHEPDGSVHLYGGCDWLSLAPYSVLTTPEVDSR